MDGESLVVGVGLSALLLSVGVWIDAQRLKRRAACILAWHEQQQHTVERGGIVISVEVNPQPAQEHLHVLTTQVVRARRTSRGGPSNVS